MAKKRARLKGVAACSIVTVGLAMGAGSTRSIGPAIAAAANADSCRDFAAALFIKGEDLFHKVSPFLKYGGVETGFQKAGMNVGGFYHVSTGAAEVFLKDDFQDVAGIAVCAQDANGVARGFFKGVSLDGAMVSFDKVDDKQGFLKIELETVIITSAFTVGEDGATMVSVREEEQ